MSLFRRQPGPVVGDRAPDLTLTDQTGGTVRLADLLAHSPVVLFFYPKDYTPGCTAQACALRDQYEVFREAGAEVVGISSDTVHTHARFAAEHKLPFRILSDPGGRMRKVWGVPTTLGLLPGRVTYVIDQQGIVRLVFSSQLDIEGHVRKALATLDQLNPPPPLAAETSD